jgi:hypothetical protein
MLFHVCVSPPSSPPPPSSSSSPPPRGLPFFFLVSTDKKLELDFLQQEDSKEEVATEGNTAIGFSLSEIPGQVAKTAVATAAEQNTDGSAPAAPLSRVRKKRNTSWRYTRHLNSTWEVANTFIEVTRELLFGRLAYSCYVVCSFGGVAFLGCFAHLLLVHRLTLCCVHSHTLPLCMGHATSLSSLQWFTSLPRLPDWHPYMHDAHTITRVRPLLAMVKLRINKPLQAEAAALLDGSSEAHLSSSLAEGSPVDLMNKSMDKAISTLRRIVHVLLSFQSMKDWREYGMNSAKARWIQQTTSSATNIQARLDAVQRMPSIVCCVFVFCLFVCLFFKLSLSLFPSQSRCDSLPPPTSWFPQTPPRVELDFSNTSTHIVQELITHLFELQRILPWLETVFRPVCLAVRCVLFCFLVCVVCVCVFFFFSDDSLGDPSLQSIVSFLTYVYYLCLCVCVCMCLCWCGT